MATDTYVSGQQSKWEAYLTDHGIEKIFRDMTSELITAQPAAPIEFMIEYLRTQHLGAEAKGSADGGAQAKNDDAQSAACVRARPRAARARVRGAGDGAPGDPRAPYPL